MPQAAELAALLLAEIGPVADAQDLAERILGPAHHVPSLAIGAPASVSMRRERTVLLVAVDVPLLDVHRECAHLAVRTWLRRCGVGDDDAEVAAEHVVDAIRSASRPPDSAVFLRICAS